jgi:alpha-ketoglutaric semialdehyde dehydrogenase
VSAGIDAGSGVCENLIDGAWRLGSGVSENRNPSDLDDLVGRYTQGDAADVEDAVAAAVAAQPKWAEASPQARADLLDRVGTSLSERRSELGRLLAREEGKTLAEATGEVARAAQVFKFFAGEALRLRGDRLDSVRPAVDVEVTREPVGVVGLITPWNFPIAIPAWKVAPALAFGNAVVMKPADLTPGSAHALAQILSECGCPAGVFNLVMGRGSVVGQGLVEHPSVNAVSFTGSVPVGRALIARCAALQKKVQAEMGGKNPMIVLADANLEVAVSVCVNGAFGSTGQRCTASSRIIVEAAIYDRFVAALTEAVAKLRVGDALEPQTEMGPVASEAQLQTNLKYVEMAREEGVQVVGGERLERATRGYFQRPALFLGASNAARTSREEIFGPCASVIQARDFEHAVELANDTSFGLSSGICTSSLKAAREFKRRSKAGMVMVNLPTAGVDYHVPFGGRGGSSFGPREQGYAAVEFYTTMKTAYTYSP